MFAERARGRSVASLVRELNERGVVCPSSADPTRNSHRSGARWIVRTVGMMLENPRYTGRQVWNRQSTKGHGPGGRRDGRGSGAVRWNAVGEWAVSEHLAHAPLVDEATFIAVQRIRAGRPTKEGDTRRYALAGLVVCGRRMDAHWVHGRAGYRCRHGYSTATSRPRDAPRNVYVREDHLLETLVGLLHRDGQLEDHGPVDVGECLRCRGLELVCSDESRELHPAAARRIVSLAAPSGQMALALDGNPHAPEAREPGAEAVDEQPPADAGRRREGAVIGTPRPYIGIKIPHGCGDPWGKRVSEGGLEPPRPLRTLAPQASASAIPPLGLDGRRLYGGSEGCSPGVYQVRCGVDEMISRFGRVVQVGPF
jgi:Recombinase